ncbi:probable chitinase 10 [Anopheles albimanus]|uniref:probable chitinase 10 n=1 Tax=Anopheles albimanus TaxID=7167 RepID=UPI00163E8176|nr:probable chitinase 10 [Anopheles albimanus]
MYEQLRNYSVTTGGVTAQLTALFGLFALLTWASVIAQVDSKEVVCYYGTWAVYRPSNGKFTPENIDPNLCTQLNYAFFHINPDGTIKLFDPWVDLPDGGGYNTIAKVNNLKQINPSLKTIAAVGGWDDAHAIAGNFAKVAANPSLRAAFARNAVAFLQKYGFNGMDIDWEYPAKWQAEGMSSPADKANLVLLLQELRNAFTPYGYLLTIAVGATRSLGDIAYDVPAISNVVDYINLMEYDMHGSWETTVGHHAPAYTASGDNPEYSVLDSVNYWLSKGAAPAKLNLGVPFYGRTFTLTDPSQTQIGAPAAAGGTAGPYTGTAGFLGYNEICEKRWPRYWDNVRGATYAVSGNQWVGYDDVQSILLKCSIIAQYGLGGGMVWSIETDDFLGRCGTRYELLSTLKGCVNGGSPAPATTIRPPTTTANPVATTKPATVNPATTTAKPTPTTAKPTPTTTKPSGQFVCRADAYFRHPTDCNKYYVCNRGTATMFSCASGLYFNEKYSVCDWPYNVSC